MWFFPWVFPGKPQPSSPAEQIRKWYLKSTFTIPAAAAAKSLQSCPTLCDPTDSGPSGSPIPGILQARTLERVAISFSNAWKWKVKVKVNSLSHVWPLATPWTAAHQAPPSVGFSRQEYWSGVPLPSPKQSIHSMKFLSSDQWYFSELEQIISNFVWTYNKS